MSGCRSCSVPRVRRSSIWRHELDASAGLADANGQGLSCSVQTLPAGSEVRALRRSDFRAQPPNKFDASVNLGTHVPFRGWPNRPMEKQYLVKERLSRLGNLDRLVVS